MNIDRLLSDFVDDAIHAGNDLAVLAGVDLYLSGEASEQTFHSARENDISFIAAGHHATERYGVQALGDYLARRFALEHLFIDCPNPV